jgi:ribosome biogenesis protein Nip4
MIRPAGILVRLSDLYALLVYSILDSIRYCEINRRMWCNREDYTSHPQSLATQLREFLTKHLLRKHIEHIT